MARQSEARPSSAPHPGAAQHADRHPSFDRFVATVAALRAPGGCPWDREQTHASIAANLIEEAYEAVDAIESNDLAHLREELGDVLLQVVLQSQIAADQGEFDIDEVCAEVDAKMVRRHPHVFGDAQAKRSSEVLDLWEKVKLAEQQGAQKAAREADDRPAGLLDGVPTSFPALLQAQKLSRKAASAGFEWKLLDEAWAKVEEEAAELKEAYALAPKAENGKVDVGCAAQGRDGAAAREAIAAVEEEFGDVMFALVNVARRMGVDAEGALRASCGKFRRRWAFMEGAAWSRGRSIEGLSLEEREALWQSAKEHEQKQKQKQKQS